MLRIGAEANVRDRLETECKQPKVSEYSDRKRLKITEFHIARRDVITILIEIISRIGNISQIESDMVVD